MRASVVVVGAGFAGAATARHLVAAGVRDVVVVEAESVPGAHASGRNAGLLRRLVADPVVRRLSIDAAGPIAARGVLNATGAIHLLDGDGPDRLAAAAAALRAEGLAVRRLDRATVEARVPLLTGGRFGGALHVVADGVVDVHALLLSYLDEVRDGGGQVLTSTRVEEIETAGGRVVAARTTAGSIETPVVVDAAGAWAGRLGRSAGAVEVPLTAYRRHLFTTGQTPSIDVDTPWVWHDAAGYYLRPESGGLLLSACDEDAFPPGAPPVDPAAADRLTARFLENLPAAAGWTLARGWACLRTFAPDRRPVVDRDPVVEGLVRVAGLGGFGMTASDAVGALAAEVVRTGRRPPEVALHRFLRTPTGVTR